MEVCNKNAGELLYKGHLWSKRHLLTQPAFTINPVHAGSLYTMASEVCSQLRQCVIAHAPN